MDSATLTECVSSILLNEWDPIGIAEDPYMRDEYDNYVPRIVRMLLDNQSTESIAHQLNVYTEEYMLLEPDKAKSLAVAEHLRQECSTGKPSEG